LITLNIAPYIHQDQMRIASYSTFPVPFYIQSGVISRERSGVSGSPIASMKAANH